MKFFHDVSFLRFWIVKMSLRSSDDFRTLDSTLCLAFNSSFSFSCQLDVALWPIAVVG